MPPAGGRTTPPIFFPEKENGRCDRPKERRLIGSPKLEQPLCLRNATACVRRSRVSIARRFASASTTRCCAAVGSSAALRMRHTPCGCRSADLAQVQPNRRLPIIRYRGERQQYRHAGSCIPEAKSPFEPETANQIPFSWGSKGDILFPRKENIPLNRSPCAAAGNF